MFDGKFRTAVDKRTAPIGRFLVKCGFSADVLTASGLLFAGATGWAIAMGHHHWAIGLLALTGAHDLFDGPVAKASQATSVRGSFFDSVIDRLSDALILGAVAYYLEATNRGQMILLPFAIMTSTFMICLSVPGRCANAQLPPAARQTYFQPVHGLRRPSPGNAQGC